MTSYASQPTPEWLASGPISAPPAQAPPPRDEQEPVPGRQWQTGPGEQWQTAAQQRWQDQAAEQQPGPVREPVTARELWAGRLRDQAPASEPPPGGPRDLASGPADADAPRAGRLAVLSYLSVPFLGFLPPLAVYLITPRTSALARRHATQALNLSLTVLVYNICALILGGLLALDSVGVAVLIIVPLLAALWIVSLVYLVLAGTAASRGGYYQIPGWICATLVR
jgi:uncharacterized Tic20 family protein